MAVHLLFDPNYLEELTTRYELLRENIQLGDWLLFTNSGFLSICAGEKVKYGRMVYVVKSKEFILKSVLVCLLMLLFFTSFFPTIASANSSSTTTVEEGNGGMTRGLPV